MESWLKDILHKMLLAASPSGSEEQITALFAEQMRPYVNEVTTDANGNCIAHKEGTGPKVMLMAHADEIGPVSGIIGKKPIHLQSKEESGKSLSPEDLYFFVPFRLVEPKRTLLPTDIWDNRSRTCF